MRRKKNWSNRRTYPAALLVACMLVAPVFAQRGAPELPDPGNPSMTRDEQQKLGLQAAREVYRQMPVLPDSSPLTKYVQKVGERLANTIPPQRSWPFQFHVIEQKEINAFALPGGQMFVNVGTIRSADNEAELAGVMAHEMAHVYMQHSAKQQEKSSLLGGLAGIAGAIAGSMGGTWGKLAQGGIQFGAGTLMLKYSRADEAQADAVGAIILWKAGYNPVALADFFEKIAQQGSSGPQFLSDHPNPGNRREAIEREIAEWPSRQYQLGQKAFAAARKQADGAPAYSAQEISAGANSGRWSAENRKNGAILPGGSAGQDTAAATVPNATLAAIQPSAEFQETSLKTIGIARPINWDVTLGQQPDSATIAPAAGASGGSVAYGAVIQVMAPQNGGLNVQQLTQSVAQTLENSDPNMQQNGPAQDITVSGRAAGSLQLQTVSPMAGADGKAQPEQDWLVTIPRDDGSTIVMIFVSPQKDFQQLKPTFERMLRSVTF